MIDAGAGAAPGSIALVQREPTSYDLAIAANLCHLFAPQTAARLVALYATGLLTRTATGRVHDYDDYQSWLTAAGCDVLSRHDCERFPVSVVRGRPRRRGALRAPRRGSRRRRP